jgi:hypothetical protein
MRSSRTQDHVPSSPTLTDLLDEWVDAGLITREQSRSIQQHEAQPQERPSVPVLVPPSVPGPSLVVEALGYLGGVIMMVGSLLLVGLYWGDLPVPVRLGLTGLTALALVGAGVAVPDRLGEAAGRLRAVLWTLAVMASGAFFTVLSVDALDRSDEDALIVIFPATAAVAGVLWWRRRTVLQQLALLVPVLMSATAVALELADDESSWPGAAVWATAVVWTALAWVGRLEPRLTGVAMGALGAVFGAMTMTNDLGVALGLLTAAAMVGLALLERSLPWLGVAALLVLYAAPRAAVEWFPGRLSAALTLIVTGGLLVSAAIWVARHQAPHPAGEAGGEAARK